MEQWIQKIKEFWELLALIAGGIYLFLTKYSKWKSNRNKSTDMLYDELEKLKQKVILQVSTEVKHATVIAEQKIILEELKNKCPDCYDSVIKNVNLRHEG